ncbi:putative pentatricopeptide [Rosa chinensis]|uniref:Putative pentatricopeptide n=1 Tax=Rosa chinensis TaxID=74649 RepID=A0A2P6SQT8_ROSCH|nr:pentatricopeptide repeat-containing protein At2g32630 [Rosa chinensis]PRQ61036.1 putative pentatricopeptide [Rosa chinensis]
MGDTACPNSCADDLKKHVMEVFEEATKDSEDFVLPLKFSMIRNYDDLNEYAIQIFNSMANDDLLDEAKELFKPLSDQGVLPDVAALTIVIGEYAFAGEIKAALKVYQRMLATGVSPTSHTYTLLIMALVTDSSDVNYVGLAKKYFMEMLGKGLKPHDVSYISVFDAIACRESVENAREFLEQIKAKGFSLKSNVFYFDEAHLTEAMKITKLLHDLPNNTTDKDIQKLFRKWCTSGHGFQKESMKMYKTLVKDGNADEAMEVLMLFIKGIKPAILIHTCIIETYVNAGKIKGALEAYKDMVAAGVAPNSYTYTVLIKGLIADPNFFGDDKKFLLEMMDKGKWPNASTYTVVMEGFAKQEDKAAEEEGKELVEVMMGKGFVLNAKAMMEVLKGRPTAVIRRVMNIVLSKLKG